MSKRDRLQIELQKMLAQRPPLPRPFRPDSEAARAWQQAHAAWQKKHEDLLAALETSDWQGLQKFRGFTDDPYKTKL